MTSTSFFAVDPVNGEVQCSYQFYLKSNEPRPSGAILANTPVFKNDEIYITGVWLYLYEEKSGYVGLAKADPAKFDGKLQHPAWRCVIDI